jgi:proline dehydrogenase
MTLNFSDPAIMGSIITVMGGGLCGLLGWLSKSVFDSLRNRVARVEDTQAHCLENLPKCFAEKASTEKKIDEHDKRLDEHGERIVRVEGKVGI